MQNLTMPLLHNMNLKPPLIQGSSLPFLKFGTQYEGTGDPNWYGDLLRIDKKGIYMRLFGKPTSKVTDWCVRHNMMFYPNERGEYIYKVTKAKYGSINSSWADTNSIGGGYAYDLAAVYFSSYDSRFPDIEIVCDKGYWGKWVSSFYIPMEWLPDELTNEDIELCYNTSTQWIGGMEVEGQVVEVEDNNYILNSIPSVWHTLKYNQTHRFMGWNHEKAGGQGWGSFELRWLYRIYYILYKKYPVNNVDFNPSNKEVSYA